MTFLAGLAIGFFVTRLLDRLFKKSYKEYDPYD
jgi:uncharacterized protein YneF (UPF0154 family)